MFAARAQEGIDDKIAAADQLLSARPAWLVRKDRFDARRAGKLTLFAGRGLEVGFGRGNETIDAIASLSGKASDHKSVAAVVTLATLNNDAPATRKDLTDNVKHSATRALHEHV
jgi:hypothetical protein